MPTAHTLIFVRKPPKFCHDKLCRLHYLELLPIIVLSFYFRIRFEAIRDAYFPNFAPSNQLRKVRLLIRMIKKWSNVVDIVWLCIVKDGRKGVQVIISCVSGNKPLEEVNPPYSFPSPPAAAVVSFAKRLRPSSSPPSSSSSSSVDDNLPLTDASSP